MDKGCKRIKINCCFLHEQFGFPSSVNVSLQILFPNFFFLNELGRFRSLATFLLNYRQSYNSDMNFTLVFPF